MWHSVSKRPWPIIIRINTFAIFCSLLMFFHEGETYYIKNIRYILLLVVLFWCSDIYSEHLEGEQTYTVKDGLKVAIIIFILSEVLFFVSWFWGFFHSSLSPINEIGNMWPPIGIRAIDPLSIPLLNTFLLLSSGISVTWAHNIFFNIENIITQIFITIFLGIVFTLNQGVEYLERRCSICDSIYGRTFFITTGFHGVHVLFGSIFLCITYCNIIIIDSNPILHYIAFEFAIWYWHFVDVVWLFLITFLYLLI